MRNTETGYRMDEMRSRFDRLRDRHTNGTAPQAIAAHQLFQTPPALAARMVELADIQPGHAVLEPSAGLGRILRPILERNPASVTACEVNADLAGELFRTFPGVTLWQGDFLERRPTYEGGGSLLVKPFPNAPPVFDRIVMNPPFTMRSDLRHIEHARQFLATGGVLVGLCLSTHHRETALRDSCDVWEVIPAGTFRAEGTGVETILFRITQ
jgi:phospholipid N-methyltransferase